MRLPDANLSSRIGIWYAFVFAGHNGLVQDVNQGRRIASCTLHYYGQSCWFLHLCRIGSSSLRFSIVNRKSFKRRCRRVGILVLRLNQPLDWRSLRDVEVRTVTMRGLDLNSFYLRGRRLPRPHDVTEALEEEFHGLSDLGRLLLEYHGTVLVLYGMGRYSNHFALKHGNIQCTGLG